MDFLKFNMNNLNERQLQKLIKEWNLKTSHPFGFLYRIEKIEDDLVCTFMMEDDASLKKAVRSFPVALYRACQKYNNLSDILEAEKIGKFLCNTRLTEFICGYVRKDFADEIKLKNIEEELTNYSSNVLRPSNTVKQISINYKVKNTPVLIQDKTAKNEETKIEYYPIVFELNPDQFYRKNSSQKFNKVNATVYANELRKRYNIFYAAVKEMYDVNSDDNFYFTNLIGDKKTPSQADILTVAQMYSGAVTLTKNSQPNT